MTTVEEVFEMAVHLMDEQNDATGAAEGRDVEVYRRRALSIVNAVLPGLYPFSDTYEAAGAGRPQCPAVTGFDQAAPVDDALARGVLPYALAAHLLAGEDEARSLWLQSQYNLRFGDLRTRLPGRWERIALPYGTF